MKLGTCDTGPSINSKVQMSVDSSATRVAKVLPSLSVAALLLSRAFMGMADCWVLRFRIGCR